MFKKIVILFMMIMFVPFATYAKDGGVDEATAYAVLHKDPKTLTDQDFKDVLHLALKEKITVEQVQMFLDQLEPHQATHFDEIIEQEIAVHTIPDTPEELEQAQQNEERLRAEHIPPSILGPEAVNACDPAALQQGFCWQQFVEYFSSHNDIVLEWKYPSWHQNYTTICDTEPDTDLVLFFDISSINPDNLRWGTSSAGIYMLASGGGSLNSFDFDNWGAHLCINNAVTSFYNDATVASNITIKRIQ